MDEMIKVEVENVRCIKQCAFDVPVHSRTVLVGTNNAGKSSLLDATSQALRAMSLESQQKFIDNSFYRRQADEYYRPQVSLDLPVRHVLSKGLEIAPDADRMGVLLVASSPAESTTPNKAKASSFIPVRIELKKPDGSQLYLLNSSKKVGVIDLETDPFLVMDPRLRDPRLWGQSQLTQASSSGHRIAEYYKSDSPLVWELGKWSSNVFYFPAMRSAAFEPGGGESALNVQAINNVTPVMKRVLYEDRHWRSLSMSVSLLFDEISELKFIEVHGGLAPHALLRSGGAVPVRDMGFGFRNAVHLLVAAHAAPKDSVLVIDEPEQGLNQSRQQEFATLLETVRGDITLVFATQSEAFCRGLSASNICVIEPSSEDGASRVYPIALSEPEGRRRLAKSMGVSPLYLFEGGRILFVEGISDKMIVSDWLKLNFGHVAATRLDVQALGGTGKIVEEFARPMFENFKEHIFFILDSDGSGPDERVSVPIASRIRWFKERGISNYIVMGRREIENYIGHDAVAEAAGIHPSKIRPMPGQELWQDLKRAVKDQIGYYDERKITVGAYELLDLDRRKGLFREENSSFLEAIGAFLKETR